MRKISGSEAFKVPMCTLFNMSPGPPVGTPLSVRAPLEPIKGRAHMLENKFSRVHELTSLHTHHKFHRHSEEFTPTRKLTLIKG
jgi:hypothetical protein